LLLTHPELWLEPSIAGRDEYLSRVLTPLAARASVDFVEKDVRSIWIGHEGARAHDSRESLKTTPGPPTV
jgi:hypothetical protein